MLSHKLSAILRDKGLEHWSGFVWRKYSLSNDPILLYIGELKAQIAVLSGELEWEIPAYDIESLLRGAKKVWGDCLIEYDIDSGDRYNQPYYEYYAVEITTLLANGASSEELEEYLIGVLG